MANVPLVDTHHAKHCEAIGGKNESHAVIIIDWTCGDLSRSVSTACHLKAGLLYSVPELIYLTNSYL